MLDRELVAHKEKKDGALSLFTTSKIKDDSFEPVWERVKLRLSERVNSQTFDVWFKTLEPLGIQNKKLVLVASDRFRAEWIINHYKDIVEELLSLEVGYKLEPIFIGKSQLDESSASVIPPTTTLKRTKPKHTAKVGPLPPSLSDFTFERFVVGPNNSFACAAAQAVSEKPGEHYNPLFIFGGVGIGKTHLASAIVNKAHKKFPNLHVRYASAETFLNDFISALRNNRVEDFRYRYRMDCDFLVIDDIQFLAGKTQTQEEFFHTFNALYQQKKQIVVTSDKFPEEIPDLEQRLCSRLQWGVVADIQPPELETRIAILQENANRLNVVVPDNVLQFVAQNIESNVRELEGALSTLVARASLLSKPVDMELARQVVSNTNQKRKIVLTFETIMSKVAAEFGIRVSEMVSEKRMKRLVVPRYVAMYFARKFLNASYPEIGRRFGNRDHKSVMNAISSLDKRSSKDHELKALIETLEKNLDK